MDLSKIKYYPDKFYLCLDGFDLKNLKSFDSDYSFNQQQSIYIHEYYHYLTNLTTYQGIRQFNINFQDRIRLLCILLSKVGIDAFPLNENKNTECKNELKYWKDIQNLIDSEDLDYYLAKITSETPSKSFRVSSISEYSEKMEVVVNGETYHGERFLKKVEIDGIPSLSSFKLSIGAIDEFLSASIDEFLFEHNMANNSEILNKRPFYPYRLFDEILKRFDLYGMSNLSKILISYFALHSFNPVVCFIEVLESVKEVGLKTFEDSSIEFLSKLLKGNEINIYVEASNYVKYFADECHSQKRENLAKLMDLIKDKSDICSELMKKDYFYFVRPFLTKDIDSKQGREEFLKQFKAIKCKFEEPLILQNQIFVNADETPLKQHLAIALAIYEILKSIESNKIAQRSTNFKTKYSFPVGDDNSDKLESINGVFPITDTWQIALNEVSLYGVYLELKK